MYRIVRNPHSFWPNAFLYSIDECFMDSNNNLQNRRIRTNGEESLEFCEESIENLKMQLEEIHKAFELPIVEYDGHRLVEVK